MEDITQEISNDVMTNRVHLLRATVNEADLLRKLLEEQMVFGYSKIVVDLSQCTHLDSTFIGVLVITQKKLLASSGELKIVDPLEPAKELFYLTGIAKIFDTFEVAEEAINSFTVKSKTEPVKTENQPERKSISWVFA